MVSALFQCLELSAAEPVRLTIDANREIGRIDERIYGQFLEHIYHACHGGLWGDVVWNRSFEERQPDANDRARHWNRIGGSGVILETNGALNGRTCVRIATGAAGAGVAQSNFCVRAGDTLRGSLWLRGQAADGLFVRLRDGERILAEQRVESSGTAWSGVDLALTPAASADFAVLEIVTRGAAEVALDQVSLMPDSYRVNGGFRTDLLEALAGLKPSSIRWPGGTFTAGYRWKDAIGPQHQRVDKGRVQWDEIDPLAFGIDEFVSLCRRVGAEPVVVLNIGPRSQSVPDAAALQDALDFVEYCNGAATSTWGRVRAENGHPEPHRVKYWELDNEIYLTPMPASNYVRIADTFAKELKRRDPGIVVIGCGGGGVTLDADRGWQRTILAGELAGWDLVSLHKYENYKGAGGGHLDDTNRFVRGVASYDAFLGTLAKAYAKSSKPDLRLYISEWNYMSTDWRTGLYAGGLLNTLERHGDLVAMACPALLFRHVEAPQWDNAFINFDHRGWFAAPNYVVMKLWRDHFAPVRIGLSGEADGLNAIATRGADGRRLVVKLVNTAETAMPVELALESGFEPAAASLAIVAPDDLLARNTMARRDAVRVQTADIRLSGQRASFTLPRWSAGVAELTR